MRSFVAIIVLALALGCGGKRSAADRPKVAVSIFPLYDLTRRIAGDRLDVELVLPPGKSEHAYDPTPQEMARLSGAKLGVAVGLDMDTWVEPVMQGATIVHVGDVVKTMKISASPIGAAADDDRPGAPDPHVWLDPQRMIGAVDAIANELAAIDPAGKDAFANNASAVKAALHALDERIAGHAKMWTKVAIVTFHGSMSYFADRYHLAIVAVVEPIVGKEPSPKLIADVVGAIARTHAAALFTEPQFDRAPGETIAREAGVPLGELDPVGGVPGRDSYEKLLDWNTEQLDKVLK